MLINKIIDNGNQERENFAKYTKNNNQRKDNICDGSCSLSSFNFEDIIENLNDIEKEVRQWPDPCVKKEANQNCIDKEKEQNSNPCIRNFNENSYGSINEERQLVNPNIFIYSN